MYDVVSANRNEDYILNDCLLRGHGVYAWSRSHKQIYIARSQGTRYEVF